METTTKKKRDPSEMPTIVKVGIFLMLAPFFIVVSAPFVLVLLIMFGWMLESLMFRNGILPFVMSVGTFLVLIFVVHAIGVALLKGAGKKGVTLLSALREFVQFSRIPTAWYKYLVYFAIGTYFSTFLVFQIAFALLYMDAVTGVLGRGTVLSLSGAFNENIVLLSVLNLGFVYYRMQHKANNAVVQGQAPVLPFFLRLYILVTPVLGFFLYGYFGLF